MVHFYKFINELYILFNQLHECIYLGMRLYTVIKLVFSGERHTRHDGTNKVIVKRAFSRVPSVGDELVTIGSYPQDTKHSFKAI